MNVTDMLAELGKKVADLYKEVVTTSVRFDQLQSSTDKTLARVETLLDQFSSRVQVLHDEHVREKAVLEAEIRSLQGRLDALSEQAIHAVAREAARDIMRGAVATTPELLRSSERIAPGSRKKLPGA